MTRIRSKICGITRPDDGRLAADCGADAIGLVFYPGSSRHVSRIVASQVCRALPVFVTVTGLFVNPAESEVLEVLSEVPLDLLQFHGEESPAFCAGFGRPYMKAIRVRPGLDVRAEIARYPEAAALLLDAWDPAQAGGTGQRFDWSVAAACVQASEQRIVLAGGLTPDNVGEAIEQVKPYAVDVSSGVERAPGIKDPGKIAAFMREVNRVRS